MLDMTRPTLALAIAATAFALVFTPPAPTDARPPAERAASSPGPDLQRTVDAQLRIGLGRIRAIVDARLRAPHAGRLTAAQYRGMADEVHAEVVAIAAARGRVPGADAKLHGLLAALNQGIDTMAGQQPKLHPAQGLGKVLAAINEYGRAVDHPGFGPAAAVQ